MEILNGELQRNETNQNAMGGTELLAIELQQRVPKSLLKEFQIVSSRVRELAEDKIRIFWAHDLPGDPESEFLKDKTNQDKFHLFIFVSNWQMQAYINYYRLPWGKCHVVWNAIDPIPEHEKPDGDIHLTYFSTPQRGLDILVPVFEKLCEEHDNIQLDVFSSFKLYGWDERDKRHAEVFKRMDAHPKINNYGAVDHGVLREALTKAHILAYPSIWQETSCRVLMEAMSAKLQCVHSNLGALFETSGPFTRIYQYQDNPNDHAHTFYQLLNDTIKNHGAPHLVAQASSAKAYIDAFYGWERRAQEWQHILTALTRMIDNRSIPKSQEGDFVYKTT